MTSYPAWTPASRPGIIPLHPLTFGTILGRSFTALRQNPKVLLGFALVVQTVAYLLVVIAVAGVAIAAFARLDTVPTGSEDYETILAGSVALTVGVGIVLGLAAGAFSVIVQGIVVSEVSRAVVAEKLRLRDLWRRVRPVAWRLVGYTLLVLLAVLLLFGVVILGIVAVAALAPPIAILLTILTVLAAFPIAFWLQTKLVAVPAAIVLEHASVFGAIGRSWRLLRGRFWPALGVVVLISFVMGALAQIVSLPLTFLSSGLSVVLSPTGDPTVVALVTLVALTVLTQVITLLIQAMALVIQSTAATLIYVDCRMRHEGLDLDLQTYVDRRDAGYQDLPDPYTVSVGRPRTTPAVAPWGESGPATPSPIPPAAMPPQPPAPAVSPPAAPAPPSSSTQWAAPGAPTEDESRP